MCCGRNNHKWFALATGWDPRLGWLPVGSGGRCGSPAQKDVKGDCETASPRPGEGTQTRSKLLSEELCATRAPSRTLLS